MDKDEKLLAFLDSLGPDTDVEFARQMLEASDWDLEAALNIVTGDAGAPSPAPAADSQLPPDYVDEEGYRAPMRTGYRDTLLGGDPEDMVWEQASRFADNGRGGGGRDADREAEAFAHLGREDLAGVDGGEPRRRSHRNGDESVSSAMRASQQEYRRQSDQQEQGAIADALQASYAEHNAAEQRRLQQGFQDQSEEQKLIAQAIEASFKEQNDADATYRAQLERAMEASKAQDTATFPSTSGRGSPIGAAVPSASSSRGVASSAPRPSASAAGRDLGSGVGGRRPDRPSPASQAAPSVGTAATSRMRPSSGEAARPRAADLRAEAAAALSSASQGRQPVRQRSGGTAGEVPSALSVNGRLSGSQPHRSSALDAPGSRGSGARSVGESNPTVSAASAARSSAVPNRFTASGGSGSGAAQSFRDPAERAAAFAAAAAAGPTGVSGAAARGIGLEKRPIAPELPLPRSPPPPEAAASSHSPVSTPPNGSSLRQGLEEPRARDPRAALVPLNPPRGPGQDAALRGLREATDADKKRYSQTIPPEEERLRRDSREADLRKREATRETEELRQRREAESRSQVDRRAEAERRRREQEAEQQRRAAAERESAAAEAAEAAAADRRRREEAQHQKRREEIEQRRQKEEAAEQSRKDEEQSRQRAEEAKRSRVADAEAAATAAAAEAERKKREAAEFEVQREAMQVETRRREAKEAEELAQERREADERKRQVEREGQPEEKDKEVSDLNAALVSLRRKYKEDPGGLATCLKTLGTYIKNLANNPQEQKYQRINTENNAFRTRVAAFEGSTAVLTACGFTADGATLVVDSVFLRTKGPRLFDACAKIDVLVGQLQK